jgi:hypothetical protein
MLLRYFILTIPFVIILWKYPWINIQCLKYFLKISVYYLNSSLRGIKLKVIYNSPHWTMIWWFDFAQTCFSHGLTKQFIVDIHVPFQHSMVRDISGSPGTCPQCLFQQLHQHLCSYNGVQSHHHWITKAYDERRRRPTRHTDVCSPPLLVLRCGEWRHTISGPIHSVSFVMQVQFGWMDIYVKILPPNRIGLLLATNQWTSRSMDCSKSWRYY